MGILLLASVQQAQSVAPDPVVATLAVAAPTVTVGAVTVSPSPVVATLIVPDPVVTKGTVTLQPDAVVATLVVADPVIGSGTILTPDAVVLTLVVAAPTLAMGGVSVSPSPVVLSLALPDPSIELGALTITPDPVGASLVVPDPSVTRGLVTVAPDPVVLTLDVPAPAVSTGGATASPDPVVLTLVVVAPSVSNLGGRVVPLVHVVRAWAARNRVSLTLAFAENWAKHRLEKEVYRQDFGAELAASETLLNPTVKLFKLSGTTWLDVTDQFGAPAPVVSTGQRSGEASAQVDFWLHGAGGSDQEPGRYSIRIEADTTNGRHLTALVREPRSNAFRLPQIEVLSDARTVTKAQWTKHRLEQQYWGCDLGDHLEAGEVLLSPSVAVLRVTGDDAADVTAEFGSPAPTISTGLRTAKASSQVDYTTHEAGADQQDGGLYVTRVEADTSAGRHLVATVVDPRTGQVRLPALLVLEEGDPSAP